MELNDMMKRGWRLLAICLLVLAGGTAVADPSVCVDCHEGEVAEWSRSQHAVAMAEASPEAVAGDFSGARYQDSELAVQFLRSEEHTSELQSRPHLVCRLLLEKKKTNTNSICS